MPDRLFILLYFFIFVEVQCGYPPIGDEVQAGSVLLPASRRGRYLANIVRRQAVDGTGIKFNKDADRMNADAKKKVDVLSEELLPYIIAEQERRTTLYKRVMTAIQNGEKGVTIAEIRNKPPAIIRKGLMYRCPTNRAPKEPDGSGVIMCEDGIEPTPIMYESCLSAEDKELYVAENKYFFCNRHKIEGPDLPRNGTTVIGCAPCERTSLNYTSTKCTLEDTDDVVVHYRYYPDRTYKFVTELDPDREVCEHWNPCQIGYIFSLPSPDQATPASELWHDYIIDENYEGEEFVTPVPEDTTKEFVKTPVYYESSLTKIRIPPGMKYTGIGKYVTGAAGGRHKDRISTREGVVPHHVHNIDVEYDEQKDFIKIKIKFNPMEHEDVGLYFVRFDREDNKDSPNFVDLVEFEEAMTDIEPLIIEAVPGQKLNQTHINMTCLRCTCKMLMIRGEDGSVRNIDTSKFRIHKLTDTRASLDIDIEELYFQDFGEYFAHITLADGTEERMKVLIIRTPERDNDNVLEVVRLEQGATVGKPLNAEIECDCKDCEITNVFCHGEDVLKTGHVTVVKRQTPLVSFNIPNFEDSNSCVYLVTFKKGVRSFYNILAVIENDSNLVSVSKPPLIKPPPEGQQFEKDVKFKCNGGDCKVETVMLNGVPLFANTRRTNVGAMPFYVASDRSITFRYTDFIPLLMGVNQATFTVQDSLVTKNVMEIGITPVQPLSSGTAAADGTTDKPEGDATTSAEGAGQTTAGEAGETTAGEGAATTPADGEAPTTGGETGETTAGDPGDPTTDAPPAP